MATIDAVVHPCPTCDKRTAQIRYSVYAGDYQQDGGYAEYRQCTMCGSLIDVQEFGKQERRTVWKKQNIPPRNDWERPMV